MSFRIAECRYTKTKVFTLANHNRRNNAMNQSGLEANTVHVCIHAISAPFTCFVSICMSPTLTNEYNAYVEVSILSYRHTVYHASFNVPLFSDFIPIIKRMSNDPKNSEWKNAGDGQFSHSHIN